MKRATRLTQCSTLTSKSHLKSVVLIFINNLNVKRKINIKGITLEENTICVLHSRSLVSNAMPIRITN